MDIEQVANTLIEHLLDLEKNHKNDQELGKETRKFLKTFKSIRKEYSLHDAEVKRLIDGN